MFQIFSRGNPAAEPAPWISKIVLGPRPVGVDQHHGRKQTGKQTNIPTCYDIFNSTQSSINAAYVQRFMTNIFTYELAIKYEAITCVVLPKACQRTCLTKC
jgi:hypothetical protein